VRSPSVALVTQRHLPDWEHDDLPLGRALEARGAAVHSPVWDDPTVDWARFDVAVVRTTWDYMPRRDAFVAWAERAAAATRLLNPAPVLAWNTDKSYLAELAELGAPLLPTLWLERGGVPDLASALADRGWPRALIKPRVGNSAIDTLRFDVTPEGLDRARAHLARLLPHGAMLVQPYQASVETQGELSAVFFDGALSHALRKVPRPGDYRVQDDHGATDAPATLTASERDLAASILAMAETRLRLDAPLAYARVDFLRTDTGALVLNELELVEPSLFFRHSEAAPARFADAILGRI
jgi:glutathione synthase/RimK-type ligase-like ATP-grasp enzyme